jgi:Domain of unknown function (DUF2427)/Protein YTP1-like, C-terminal
MLGVAQSPFHIPVQLAFLVLTSIGVIFAIMYNSATPDFYENNAHHKIGWVIVWMIVAQVTAGLITAVARYVNRDLISSRQAEEAENLFMLGDEGDEDDDAIELKNTAQLQRNSDSGHGSGESSPRGGSTSSHAPQVPYVLRRSSENTLFSDRERNFRMRNTTPRNVESKIERYFARQLQSRGWLSRIGRRGAFLGKILHAVIGRPFFCLGFIQICTGIVTVTGIFKSWNVYSGLAHFIKGSRSKN